MIGLLRVVIILSQSGPAWCVALRELHNGLCKVCRETFFQPRSEQSVQIVPKFAADLQFSGTKSAGPNHNLVRFVQSLR